MAWGQVWQSASAIQEIQFTVIESSNIGLENSSLSRMVIVIARRSLTLLLFSTSMEMFSSVMDFGPFTVEAFSASFPIGTIKDKNF